jgi:dihydroorotase
MIELLSVQPARILGVAGGSLAEGNAADITVIDPEKTFIYREEDIVSKSSNSPFLGWELNGKAVLTIVDGKITYRDL